MKSYLSLDTKVKLKKLRVLPPHIHFIGIGGIGMSALAMILAKNGYSISGSDIKNSHILKELANNHVTIFKTQKESNIDKILEKKNKNILVVISSAIRPENLELKKAKDCKLQIKHRSEILKFLIDQKKSIVISGSHGKTTTSTYITTILSILKKDPTAVIGGIVPLYNKNYNVSNSEILVAEADESDGSLVNFNSNIGIITNVELEHVDHYKDLEDVIKTMNPTRQALNNSLRANFGSVIR